jgi:hypothetical protein
MMAMLAAAALTAGLLGTGAGADGQEPGTTIDSAAIDGPGTATVTGSGVFADTSVAQDVGGAITKGFAEPGLSDPLGIDLMAGSMTTLEDGLRFTWQLKSLPPVVPPEVVRYTWSFAVNGEQYQLQAKSSNLIGTTTVDEPAGHLGNVGSEYFQLRGRCEASYMGTPVSGCYHLTFLEGEFDSGAGTVTMDLPFGRHGGQEIGPGTSLIAAESATMSIGASAQAVVSNTSTSNYINGWKTYHVGRRAEVGIGRANGTGISWTQADLAEDGTFSGRVTGLNATYTTVYARTCAGSVCTQAAAVPTAG